MKISKSGENVRRSFKNGQSEEIVESEQYDILDANGNVVGNATVWSDGANVSYTFGGFSSITEGVASLQRLLPGEETEQE